MFEEPPNYPTAYTADNLTPDDADAWAAAWVLKQQELLGGQILIVTPLVRMPAQHPILEALVKTTGATTSSQRSLSRTSWRGGPLLAAWPDRRALSEIIGDHRITALCVLTWSERDFHSWAAATRAHRLGDAQATTVAPTTISDPVVRRAMKTVSNLVNQNNTLKAGHEKAVAVAALLTLKKHGHRLDTDEIYTWALAEGWRGPRAEELRAHIVQINSGSRPRVGGNVLRKDIYTTWKAEASQPEAASETS